MEAIVAMQLRMEREVTDLRRGKTSLENRMKAMECECTKLREESSKLREECATRDSRITHLVTLVEELLGQGAFSSQQRAPNASGTTAVESQSSSAQSTPTVEVSGTSEPHRQSSLATEIATGIDLRALGGAIAEALQWRVGDSDGDSESELSARPARCDRGPVAVKERALASPSCSPAHMRK